MATKDTMATKKSVPAEITPEKLRRAYLTLHALLDSLDLSEKYAEGLSDASIICAHLYPTVIGCRPGEDPETMEAMR